MAGSDRESLGLMTQQVTYSLSLLISWKSLNLSIGKEERGTGLSHLFTMLKGLCKAPCGKQSERQGVKGKSRVRNQILKIRNNWGIFTITEGLTRGSFCVAKSCRSLVWDGEEREG